MSKYLDSDEIIRKVAEDTRKTVMEYTKFNVQKDAMAVSVVLMLLKMCEGIMEREKDKKTIGILIKTIEEMR